MSAQSNAPVIIIKRKKVVGGDGHHGGAWKVAYADFVTAMMAFFMLMWLLNATTESQRKGIADYFNPSIPMSRVSGGGDGAFGGDSVFSEETLAQNGTGASMSLPATEGAGEDSSHGIPSEDVDPLSQVESLLTGGGGESIVIDNSMKHVTTRQTDEGLIIEIFDLDDQALFEEGSATATQTLKDISKMIAEALSVVKNDLAINGHTRSQPIVKADNQVWNLSQARADQMRLLLEGEEFDAGRIQRVTGYADRKHSVDNPMSQRNNRIELILLRSDI
ncbi:MAG: chemotaxis protein MotB [Rhodobacterales bacterium]|nr:MAG: chemotaxis protein MotB [Rhodobacterales bacterium]